MASSSAATIAEVGDKHHRLLVAILILSVVLRVGVALYLGNEIDAPESLLDQRSYHALGQRLLEGHGFSFDRPWYPFTQADQPTAFWSFLYSMMVAAVYAVTGPYPLAMRLVQGVLGGVILPLVVYRWARRCFPEWPNVWLWAALMTAGYLYFVLYAAAIMTETSFIICLVVSMDLSLQVRDAIIAGELPDWPTTLKLGVALGLATLIRQSILPWLPVLFLGFLLISPRGDRKALFGRLFFSGLAVVLLVLPFTLRNYRVYGQFLLLNSNTGYGMYSAQHPMHGTIFREFEAAPVPQELVGGNEAANDKAFMGLGIGWVLDDPVRYLRLCLSRIRAFFEFWPSPDTLALHNIGRVGSFGLYLPFYILGWVRVARNRVLRRRLGLLAAFGAFYAILHIMTWAMVRYRLPVDAVLMPVAAFAANGIFAALWQRIAKVKSRSRAQGQ